VNLRAARTMTFSALHLLLRAALRFFKCISASIPANWTGPSLFRAIDGNRLSANRLGGVRKNVELRLACISNTADGELTTTSKPCLLRLACVDLSLLNPSPPFAHQALLAARYAELRASGIRQDRTSRGCGARDAIHTPRRVHVQFAATASAIINLLQRSRPRAGVRTCIVFCEGFEPLGLRRTRENGRRRVERRRASTPDPPHRNAHGNPMRSCQLRCWTKGRGHNFRRDSRLASGGHQGR
jgi:hypothetical protein